MKKTIQLIGSGLESSSGTTSEFLNVYKTFKNEFTAILKNKNCTVVEINKGHFYISGFFKNKNGQMYYFNSGDLRNAARLLYRTAVDNKDFTGGSNCWAELNDLENTLKID